MNEEKKNEIVSEEKVEKLEKKIPVIIELGDSNLAEVEGGAAYRCEPAASAY